MLKNQKSDDYIVTFSLFFLISLTKRTLFAVELPRQKSTNQIMKKYLFFIMALVSLGLGSCAALNDSCGLAQNETQIQPTSLADQSLSEYTLRAE